MLAISQNAGPAPSTEPNAPNTSGNTTWLEFMIVVRTPSASPTRPAGERSCSSDITFGCAAPRPSPSRKAAAINGASVVKNGISANPIAAVISVNSSTCHSR